MGAEVSDNLAVPEQEPCFGHSVPAGLAANTSADSPIQPCADAEIFSSAAGAASPDATQAAPTPQNAECRQSLAAAGAANPVPPSPRGSAVAPKERHSSLKLEVPGGARRVLLHACCAPCCGAIVECLQENGIEPVIFFSNSNIYPLSEYERRRAECERWAAARGVVFVGDEYDHAAWREAVLGLENEPERGRRCSACFRFRLLRAAQYAASHGFTVLTTSLASSRWKNLDQVNEAGLDASAAGQNLLWWPQNWRKGGLQERRDQIIREQNFYNQLYCGCEFSLATSPAIARQAAETDSQ